MCSRCCNQRVTTSNCDTFDSSIHRDINIDGHCGISAAGGSTCCGGGISCCRCAAFQQFLLFSQNWGCMRAGACRGCAGVLSLGRISGDSCACHRHAVGDENDNRGFERSAIGFVEGVGRFDATSAVDGVSGGSERGSVDIVGASSSVLGERSGLKSSVVGLSGGVLGPNTLRNREKREKKKRRKEFKKKKQAGEEPGSFKADELSSADCSDFKGLSRYDQITKKSNWRDGNRSVGRGDKAFLNSGSSLSGSKGFWNSCSDEVRQQLIDSKAKMHIAENQRKQLAAELKHKQDKAALDAANSVPALISQMVAVSRLANQLVKTTKDDQVHGWAKTVADSLTKSVAESAISKSDSLPSLESVGYGDSALKSSDGESAKSRRLLLYQAKVEEFDKLVEEDRFDTVNQEVAYKKALDDEYADVLLSEYEFFEKKMTDSVVNYYMSNGKGLQEIESAIAGMGLPPRDLHAEFYSEI